MKKINEKTKKLILQDIATNLTYKQIGKKYNVNQTFVSNLALEHGIKRSIRSNDTSLRVWSIPTIDKYLLDHQSTIRRNFITFINVKIPVEWKCTLCNNLFKSTFDNLRRRNYLQGCPQCGRNQYTTYHDILDSINPLSAYFLGAFVAKGHMKHNNNITFCLQNKEKLENFAKIISCTYPIITTSKNIFRLTFKSPKIVSKIKELNKNGILSILKQIPQNLMHDFTRGYFDFKGYVEYLNNYPNTIRVNISGHKDLTTNILSIYNKCQPKITSYTNAQGYLTSKSKTKNYKEMHITGLHSSFHFLSWLYNTNVNTLKYIDHNKYNAYLYAKNLINTQRIKRNQTVIT